MVDRHIILTDSARVTDSLTVTIRRVVEEIVFTPATLEDYEKLAEVVQEAQEQSLGPNQIEAKIRDATPFAGVLQFLSNSQNRTEVWAVIGIIVMILLHMLNQQQPTKVEVVAPSIDEIVERVVEQMDRNQPAKPPPTTSRNATTTGTSPEANTPATL
jgi:hypothetical protein